LKLSLIVDLSGIREIKEGCESIMDEMSTFSLVSSYCQFKCSKNNFILNNVYVL